MSENSNTSPKPESPSGHLFTFTAIVQFSGESKFLTKLRAMIRRSTSEGGLALRQDPVTKRFYLGYVDIPPERAASDHTVELDIPDGYVLGVKVLDLSKDTYKSYRPHDASYSGYAANDWCSKNGKFLCKYYFINLDTLEEARIIQIESRTDLDKRITDFKMASATKDPIPSDLASHFEPLMPPPPLYFKLNAPTPTASENSNTPPKPDSSLKHLFTFTAIDRFRGKTEFLTELRAMIRRSSLEGGLALRQNPDTKRFYLGYVDISPELAASDYTTELNIPGEYSLGVRVLDLEKRSYESFRPHGVSYSGAAASEWCRKNGMFLCEYLFINLITLEEACILQIESKSDLAKRITDFKMASATKDPIPSDLVSHFEPFYGPPALYFKLNVPTPE